MFVRELQKGDVVLLREDVRIEVKGLILGEVGPEQKLTAYVFDTAGKQWTLHPGDIVQLVHRPRPEGTTEQDMLQRTQSAISSATRVGTLPPGKTFDLTIHQCRVELDPFRDDDALRAVREAIEAWELGKPEQKL